MSSPTPDRLSFLFVIALSATALTTRTLFADPPKPTGTIAFVRGDFGAHRKVWLIDADGSNLRALTDDNERLAREDRPSWSPDGQRIALTKNDRVVVCTEDGKDMKALTPEGMDAGHPSWSPDGKSIAFHAWSDEREHCFIHTMNSDGTNIKKLTHWRAYHWMPHWSPAGDRIVYESLMKNREVFTMSIDATNVTNLSRNSATDHAPSFSPDGKRIAFMSGRSGENAEIWVMDVEGNNLLNLTKHPHRDSEPAWSPDGQWLAFTRTSDKEDEPMNILIMRSDGSDQVNLTKSVGAIDNWAPAWR